MAEAGDNSDKVDELRRMKTRLGSRLKRTRNKLQDAIVEDNRREVRSLRDEIVDLEDQLKMNLEEIIDIYREKADKEMVASIINEMDYVDSENRMLLQAASKLLLSKTTSGEEDTTWTSGVYGDAAKAKCGDVGRDLWKQLQRVQIPVFSGDKMAFESWRSAFESCVDKAPATAEYKLLQLRQCLQGEALRTIEGLGHSAAAYEIAKERLLRKYGGQRRQLMKYISALRDFRPMKWESMRELEKFADLLDIAAANLSAAGLDGELGNGMTYAICLSKLTESLAAEYHKWTFENHEDESVQTLRSWVLRQVEFRSMAMEDVNGLCAKFNDSFGGRERMQKQTVSRSYFQATSSRSCSVCSKDHVLWKCPVFKAMSIEKRWDVVKENRLCFLCILRGHDVRKCKWTRPCGIDGCTRRHNQLLHISATRECNGDEQRQKALSDAVTKGESAKENSDVVESDTLLSSTHHISGSDEISFRTIPAIIQAGQRRMKVTIMLDDASSTSYINEDIAAELKLDGPSRSVSVNVVNGKMETFWSKEVEFSISNVDGTGQYKVSALTTDKVVGNLTPVPWHWEKNRWEHLRTVPFAVVNHRQPVDILIGADCIELHRCILEKPGRVGEPIARLTPLGWTCVGKVGNIVKSGSMARKKTTFSTFFSSQINANVDLDSALRRFWEIEDLNKQNPVFSAKEQGIIDSTKSSMRFVDGRYEVAVPWKQDSQVIPCGYELAMQRLLSAEKKLKNDANVAEAYQHNINDYVRKGYVRKLSREESVELPAGWLLPHFPVVRMDKATTKVRMVFDAAARVNGISLNDMIETGPNLQQDLFSVILRFRKHDVALVCDISEMYLQIKIPEKDRSYFRFLWREMNQDSIPSQYEFNRVIFGMNASPFLAQFVCQEHARKFQERYPQAAETVLKSTYMDDSMDSKPTVKQSLELYKELSSLWQAAGMSARKWLSNSREVMAKIPQENRAAEIDIFEDALPQQKALGIMWRASEDSLFFCASKFDDRTLSKRSILRKVATIFDPLGFLTPFSVTGRLLIQRLWSAGIDWDEHLPPDIENDARRWLVEVDKLGEIEVERSLKVRENTALHIFVDASTMAYGAVSYAFSDSSSRIHQRMIAAKSKVAPLKSISVPRLELMAAIVGVRLASRVCSALDIDIKTVVFWSDSMNVLCWIRRNSRIFKPFVAHRVGEIQTLTNPSQWRYVPTESNPADLLTRGLSVSQLKISRLWWRGPDFLLQPKEEWPKAPSESGHDELEMRKAAYTTYFGQQTLKRGYIPIECLYSSWQKLIRVQAWTIRFINNARAEKENRISGELGVDELHDAETAILRSAQQKAFNEDYQLLMKGKQISSKSGLWKLNPMIDCDGLIRIDGRLRNVDYMPYNARHPIILPKTGEVTRLLVKQHHEDGFHGGTNQTLTSLTQRFWIIAGREAVRCWENECSVCKRRRSQPACQIMAPLSRCRITQTLRAFSISAVDFGGPFLTKQGRGRSREKRYLCLFTCLATRAVHMEVAYGLDTDSFLNAFVRMVGRRGLPSTVFSDNGTNFKAADTELKELVKKLDQDQITKSLANRGIKWNFNPPGGPHFGGAHESMIKSAKRAINGVLQNAEVNDEELTTIFVGVESLLNSRPITYQTSNHLDPEPLTPNHFLHGMIGGQFAPDSVDTTDFPLTKRWRRVQELIRHVWRRWLREYIPTLQSRPKWNATKKNFTTGDIVLVVEPNASRGNWPLGIITEVFPGSDGNIRVVKVKINGKQFIRPITRLCLLESPETMSEDAANPQKGENVR